VDQIQMMRVFVRVAQRSGFAAAARDLSMSPAAVTKHVAALESRVRSRLFNRTTRRVGLTEAGRAYLERCLAALQAFEDADASLHQLSEKPSGRLRVTAPVDLGRRIMSTVSRFMKAYPDVIVDLQLSNRPVDMVDEGFDIALRVAPSLNGQFVARQLAALNVVVLGAPGYLRECGTPKRPEDLAKHRLLVFTEPRPREEWQFERAGRRVTVKVEAAMLTNNALAMMSAGCEGVGLFVMPTFVVVDEVESGRVVPVLTDWVVQPQMRLYAAYPHRRFLPAKVRLFVEVLRDELGDPEQDPFWPAMLEAAKPRAS
jgi:DNA-binding transcriptional LysR family regulator